MGPTAEPTIKSGKTRVLGGITEAKPETTYDNFAQDFGQRFVPGYNRPSTVDFLMNAPFED